VSDIIDDANERADLDLQLALAAQRRRATDVQPLPKVCDNGCGEKPAERSRYCSKDCMLDHSARQTQRRRAGD